MNKIVREHYPAAALPEGLREQFASDASVTLTIVEEPTRTGLGLDELLQHVHESQRRHEGRGITLEEAVARVRVLRDEWDD